MPSSTKDSLVGDQLVAFRPRDGRIVERGRFGMLAAGKGIFARMVAEGGFTVPKALDEHARTERRDAI